LRAPLGSPPGGSNKQIICTSRQSLDHEAPLRVNKCVSTPAFSHHGRPDRLLRSISICPARGAGLQLPPVGQRAIGDLDLAANPALRLKGDYANAGDLFTRPYLNRLSDLDAVAFDPLDSQRAVTL